jgi:hypothetical protein
MSLLLLFTSAGAPTGTAYAGLAEGTATAAASSQSILQPALLATSTGDAYGATVTIGATASAAAATGAALAAAPSVGQPAGIGAASGSALDATVATAVSASAGAASGTGDALAPSPTVGQPAGVAEATGAGLDATAQTSSATLPVWTAPPDASHMAASPDLTFTIPAVGDGIHFWLELDTADTFDTGALRTYRSDLDQTGWDYWDGGVWADVPAGGVGSAYAGNEARLSVPTPLTSATWYRRVKAGV